MKNSTFLNGFFAIAIAISVVISCSEDDVSPKGSAKNEANQYVNSWIQENMSYWYLWNNELPTDVDKNLEPETYFDKLLHPNDRFSWIQEDYEELLNSLQGISREAGYEFALFREKEGSDNVIMRVVYTKPESPAAEAGLNRGDAVSMINGKQITVGNYQSLLQEIRESHTLTYKPLILEEERFGEAKTISLSTIQYTENPNYLHKVISVEDRKIGYYVYNFFASGTNRQPGRYDSEMDEVFAGFKSSGITDLVIDLRYNSGGSESAARNLASLIGVGVSESKVFLKRRYNDEVQKAILGDPDLGPDFLESRYKTKTANVGSQLASGRVYILTSSRTASASELIINSLKPFMDVFLIGDNTVGKNVGSISLYEEKDPKNTWGMQPVVVKVYNSLDASDYDDGFAPQISYQENSAILYPLGDIREGMLKLAIEEITGTSSFSRRIEAGPTAVGHSLDLKRRTSVLVMDESTKFND